MPQQNQHTMSFQNLFVTKLPRKITDNDLERIFADFRPVSAKVMLDAATGNSKGFGFVLFESVEQGTTAYEALNHTHPIVRGHSFQLCILPSKHDGRAASAESNALYVRNIPIAAATKAQVEQFLGGFGTLTYVSMRHDYHLHLPIWVVYVEYDCLECSRRALHALHGNQMFFADTPPILAKFADCEEAKLERRRRREEQTHSPPAEQPSGAAAGGHLTDSDHEHSSPTTGSYHHNPYTPSDFHAGMLSSSVHVVRSFRKRRVPTPAPCSESDELNSPL